MAEQESEEMIVDDEDLPYGSLRHRIEDAEFRESIRDARIVTAGHARTGEKIGVFYGMALLKRVIRRGAAENAQWLNVPVDPDTDDLEVLAAMVKAIKGACCFGEGA
jgi:hypothetical protein